PPGAFDGPGGEERKRRWLDAEDLQVFRNKTAYPRAWVVHRGRYIGGPIRGLTRAERREPMEEILYQNDLIWRDPQRLVFDPKDVAWVEAEDREAVQRFLSKTDPDPTERAEVAPPRHGPRRVELEATLNRPGLVVLADVFYPGWRLTIDGKDAP